MDSEKLSLCCSEEGRYLLLGDGGRDGVGDGRMQQRGEGWGWREKAVVRMEV